MTAQCPECTLYFFCKEDFIKHSSVGEIIQCPICQIELIVNKYLQLKVLDLESSDEHQE